jgi:trk system potassium uptake protein TrkH
VIVAALSGAGSVWRRPRGVLRWHALGTLCAMLGSACVAFEHGFRGPVLPALWLWLAQVALGAGVLWVEWRRAGRGVPGWWWWTLAALLAVGLLGDLAGVPLAQLGTEAALALLLLGELWRVNAELSQRLANPSVLFPLSFLALIGAGTLLIKLPAATNPGHEIGWLDALFTMTSAVCVTGLTVTSTAETFSPAGQAIIGVFIQLGGLGIIIFGSTLALLLGGRMSLRENVNLSRALDEHPPHEIASFVRFIVVTTVAIELAGAAWMLGLWRGPAGEELPLDRRIGLSLFHSVSAFCNAGFDLTGSSLEGYRHSPLTHIVIAPLIVLGGLGFLTLKDLGRWLRGRAERLRDPRARLPRLSLHTKMVLVTSLVLTVGGACSIFLAQNAGRASTDASSLAGTALDATFMSITARTAGFNSVPMHELDGGSRFTLVLLMMVGGSPGSTAGGMKTVVFAVLAISVLATLRGREETEAFGRAIADPIVKRAGTIAFCFVGLIAGSTLLLSLTEAQPFELVFFEAVSAAATVGLSLGVTPELSDAGRVIIIATMFLGRIGPLALFASLAMTTRGTARYSYPHENVSLG